MVDAWQIGYMDFYQRILTVYLRHIISTLECVGVSSSIYPLTSSQRCYLRPEILSPSKKSKHPGFKSGNFSKKPLFLYGRSV